MFRMRENKINSSTLGYSIASPHETTRGTAISVCNAMVSVEWQLIGIWIERIIIRKIRGNWNA